MIIYLDPVDEQPEYVDMSPVKETRPQSSKFVFVSFCSFLPAPPMFEKLTYKTRELTKQGWQLQLPYNVPFLVSEH